MDEAERAIHDVLCVLYSTVKETRIVYGGGCSEALMAQAVQQLVESTSGKEQHAVQSFANALRQLPIIMADNAGLGKLPVDRKFVYLCFIMTLYVLFIILNFFKD